MDEARKKSARRHPMPVRTVLARPRLFICLAIGLAALALMPGDWRLVTRELIAWNVGIVAYLASMVWMMHAATPEAMRGRAEVEDENAYVILGLSVVAAAASVYAIVAQLASVKDMPAGDRGAHIALAAFTIVTAWSFIHMMFALHYAHEFYLERKSDAKADPEQRGGLRFPATPLPDYSDFLYFSFVIGCATATADIDICSNPMRRIALLHGVIAFFFNVTVLALTINIAAGLI